MLASKRNHSFVVFPGLISDYTLHAWHLSLPTPTSGTEWDRDVGLIAGSQPVHSRTLTAIIISAVGAIY